MTVPKYNNASSMILCSIYGVWFILTLLSLTQLFSCYSFKLLARSDARMLIWWNGFLKKYLFFFHSSNSAYNFSVIVKPNFRDYPKVFSRFRRITHGTHCKDPLQLKGKLLPSILIISKIFNWFEIFSGPYPGKYHRFTGRSTGVKAWLRTAPRRKRHSKRTL